VTADGTTPALRAAVAALRDRPVSACEKGFGPIAPVTAASLAGRRPGLFGGAFTMPLLVLRGAALRQNIEGMAAYCAAAGADLAPHGKTTMAPQLFARQLAAGAWGMTAATPSHLRVYREFGVPRILLANELTDPAGIAWLAAEMAADPGFDCYVYVDSLPGVRLLDEAFAAAASAAGAAGRPLPVLVELGQPGGRAGCRTVADALVVARAAAAAGWLRLAGAAGYEGSIGHDATPATLDAVAGFCRDLRTLGERLRELAPGPERLVVTAGGSSYFDIVVRELTASPAGDPPPRIVLRSGAYVTHDHGRYAGVTPGGAGQPDRSGPELAPAFELWANVLSRPEPGLAILSAGRRDAAFDAGLPLPLRVRRRDVEQDTPAEGMTVTKLDDQHAYLSVPPDATLAPGDLLCLGISHPCTTFDKWRVVPVVDDSYRVVDAIHTFF
jgi:D-serine deaminase-like pyridoxal phosphate-dependent protein